MGLVPQPPGLSRALLRSDHRPAGGRPPKFLLVGGLECMKLGLGHVLGHQVDISVALTAVFHRSLALSRSPVPSFWLQFLLHTIL